MIAVSFPARKAAPRLLALLSILWLAACEPIPMGNLGGDGGPSIDTSRPVPVALLVPRSDQGAGAVARGLENAARLAAADLGDSARIDLRVYDTGGNAQQAAQVAQLAVNDGAQILLGPLFAEAANAAGVAVGASGVNVLSFSNNTSIAGGNVFVLGPTFENTAGRLARYAARQGKGRVVVVYPDNVEGRTGRDAIQNAAASSGLEVVGAVPFAFSEAGVVAAAPQVSEAVRAGSADSIFLTSNSAGALPLLAQLLPERGLDPQITQYIGLGRWDVPRQTLSLPGLQGGWFALPDQSVQQNFAARYAEAYGAQPHPLAGLAYDGIAAIGALVAAGKRDALTRGALTQGAGFQGTAGAFRLLPDGTNERALSVATARGGSIVILDPAPRSFGGAGL